MSSEVLRDRTPGEMRIAEALDALKKEHKPLENVVEAFRELIMAKVRLKEEIISLPGFQNPPVDSKRFEGGVSLLSRSDFIDFDADVWKLSVQRMVPAMMSGFPRLKEDLCTVSNAMSGGGLNGQKLLRAMLEGRQEEVDVLAESLQADLRSLGFILEQVAKPLVEIAARQLEPLIKNLNWHKGYCPLCGSMPELAFLKGAEGQRWLRCSFCSHEWRFPRLVCPFCETDDHTKLMIYYIADREQERVESCTVCNRYVLSMDPRGRVDELLLDIAGLGLVHLDVIAQQKGLVPAAWSGWNLVSHQDISTEPAEIAFKGTSM